ncbi:MAG: hypothetical protein WA190_00030 [Usitatibacter sp.]
MSAEPKGTNNATKPETVPVAPVTGGIIDRTKRDAGTGFVVGAAVPTTEGERP